VAGGEEMAGAARTAAGGGASGVARPEQGVQGVWHGEAGLGAAAVWLVPAPNGGEGRLEVAARRASPASNWGGLGAWLWGKKRGKGRGGRALYGGVLGRERRGEVGTWGEWGRSWRWPAGSLYVRTYRRSGEVGDEGEVGRAGQAWGRPGLARPRGKGEEGGAGRPGRLGRSADWSAQSGRFPFFFCFSPFFYFFLSFKNAFEHLNRIGKIRIIYRWIPCKKAITLKPFLKQK
jgi:hypothetical protein